MRYKFLCAIVLIFGFLTLTAQSSKTIRTYGIKGKKEVVTVYRNGEEMASYVEEIEKYNEEGDWIEKKMFDSGGGLKSYRKRIYEKNEVVEEIEIDPDGAGIKEAKPPSYDRRQYVYDRGDLILEKRLNENGDVVRLIEYEYNKFGDRETKTEKDGEGVILEIEKTEYDDRGLKIKEILFNGNQEKVKEKLFIYE